MPDLVSQLELRFGIEAERPTFRLETDNRDSSKDSPVQVFPFLVWDWNWTIESFERFYADKEILKVSANGVKHVRLYAPLDMTVDAIATELPVKVPRFDPAQFVRFVPAAELRPGDVSPFFRDLTVLDPIYRVDARRLGVTIFSDAPPSVERVGVFETVVLDTLTFANQRSAFLKYNYATEFAVAYASDFVTADGRSIDPPVFVPGLGGAFVAAENCFGAVVLKYRVQYRLYKVNYGLPPTDQMFDVQMAWMKGDITTFPMPPVTVVAIAPGDGRVSTVDFAKDVYPRGAALATWSMKSEDQVESGASDVVLTESARVTDTTRIEDPQNPGSYIDVQRARNVTLYDASGRPYTFRLNP